MTHAPQAAAPQTHPRAQSRRARICLATLQPVSARAFLVPLMGELNARGHDVHLLTSPASRDGALDIEPHDCFTTHRVPMARGLSPVADLGAVLRLARHFRKERYAVVHAHMSKCASLVLPAARLARVPLRLYTNHGMAFLSARGLKRWLLRAIEARSCGLAHRVYYVSPSNRDAAVAEQVVQSGRAAVLAHGSICGIDVERYRPTAARVAGGRAWREQWGVDERTFVVGHVGRAVAHKGYAVSLRTWARSFAGRARIHLVMVGSTVADLHTVLGREIPSNVSVIPWSDQMEDVYAAMDLVVMPSLHEGLGYTLLEAGAAGRPVIGSRIPGVVDAIEENVTGLLIAPGDEDALADAIRRLWRDPEQCARMGSAGQARVRMRFEQREVCRAFGDEYERITNHQAGSGWTE